MLFSVGAKLNFVLKVIEKYSDSKLNINMITGGMAASGGGASGHAPGVGGGA